MKCIAMGKYSASVVQAVIANPQARVENIKSLVEGVGRTWVDGFFVRGAYDFAFVCDMPNEEAVAAMHAVVYSTGAVESALIQTEMDIDKVAATATSAMGSYNPPS